MDIDPVLRNLLLLYSGIVLMNVAVSAALFVRNRNPLYGYLLFGWTACAVTFVIQGVLARGDLAITAGFAPTFVINVAFAMLLGSVTEVPVPWRVFLGVQLAAVCASIAISALGGGFTAVALPTTLAVALPSLATAARVIAAGHRRTTATMVLLVGCVLFSLHNVDFAFLRNRPEMATLGFTVATLIVFGLSIAGPAVALERVTERQVRLSTELDVARRIQLHILPRNEALPGLEMACHVRSAESVGGDYLDVYRDGDRCWFLLGDVTGHGLGAGLVMLMAQSTMSSLLHANPALTPKELNFHANQVLATNLARLQERRHMTAVSVLRMPGNRFVVSGSHDGLLVHRAGTGKTEIHALGHFPVGLGFLGELPADSFREESLALDPGDLLFLFTDGVTEAASHGDPARELFGIERVGQLVAQYARAPLDELKGALLAELERFTGGVYHDDVAFLVLRGEARA